MGGLFSSPKTPKAPEPPPPAPDKTDAEIQAELELERRRRSRAQGASANILTGAFDSAGVMNTTSILGG